MISIYFFQRVNLCRDVVSTNQVPYGDTMVVTNPTIDKVEPSQPVSDSLDFGDAGEGSNVH